MAKKTKPEAEQTLVRPEVGDFVSIPCKVVEVNEDLITLETELPGANGECNRFAVHESQVVSVSTDKSEGDKD